MPFEALRSRIQERHPGVSMKQLTERAGVPPGRLSHWFKPSTPAHHMPLRSSIDEIARITGLTVREVTESCAEDADLPWGPDDSFEGEVQRLARSIGVEFEVLWEVANDPEARQLIRDRRRIPPDRRHTLNAVALSLAGGPPNQAGHVASREGRQAH